jgi:hypothetical protein
MSRFLASLLLLGSVASPALAVDLEPGHILVADQFFSVVRHFSPSGEYLGFFFGGIGSPSYITADPGGNIYIADPEVGRITKVSPAGEILEQTPTLTLGGDGDLAVAAGANVVYANSRGTVYRLSTDLQPLGVVVAIPPQSFPVSQIALDGRENIYVSDNVNGVVRRFGANGENLGTFVTGPVNRMAFGPDGNLYVLSGETIRKYSSEGANLGVFATVANAAAMDFDGAGVLHVFAVDNSSVNTAHRFLPSGQERGTVVLAYPFPMLGVSDLLVERAPRMVLPVIADSFIRHGAANANEGANPRLRIREAGDNRVLVAFDLGHTPLEYVGRATLVLTIAENGDNWGHSHNRSIDAHPLLTGFVEGNGNDDRGSGAGVTWSCAVDAQIGNHRPDCTPMWKGEAVRSRHGRSGRSLQWAAR